ncbi:type II toxin-antitoxin system Phd/YefM family antitoxin [Cyanobium sp. N5-Cardenillas]|uniref:type II toxin-antitoxin system Phd/YefM family antitoxin n=1 Tax=Cyanobium sp. N5-Cardenillas TaxID=2823720 RepID=UPI0020CDF38D|nr:type II toxin-antitoxin system Phd/YefM family antitoxin [Cyanobium sp. N5-Cardenillas]MCP9785825.1 type II toxin-antitoxin system Phd/YefM family antitoxin [Cyanobium sp. N5-Cardenillas]
MARVSVTHLRQNLPAWLKRVQAGEAIQVTSHGRVIARIEPEHDPAEEARRWLEGLAGSVTLGDVVASIADGDADLEGAGDADHL